MDQYTRRIIGFGVHAGTIDGAALCRMFNRAISLARALSSGLSTDMPSGEIVENWAIRSLNEKALTRGAEALNITHPRWQLSAITTSGITAGFLARYSH